jgi:nicotinamidase-related amidase
MQLDFVGDTGYAATMYPETHGLLRAPIEPIKKLLDFARKAGLTIIHTREGHHPNLTDCPKNKRWRTEGVNSGIGNPASGNSLVIGSAQHDIIPELYPMPGEDVIDKPGSEEFGYVFLFLFSSLVFRGVAIVCSCRCLSNWVL